MWTACTAVAVSWWRAASQPSADPSTATIPPEPLGRQPPSREFAWTTRRLGMSTYRIAVLPGDGIGSEVMVEARKALQAVETSFPGLRFECKEYPVGARCYQETGTDLPRDTLDACKVADAILFGA